MKTRQTEPRGPDKPTTVKCQRCGKEIGMLEPGQSIGDLQRFACSCPQSRKEQATGRPDGEVSGG